MAGLMQREDGSWLAISPRGRVWELADNHDVFDVTPALSDDGRVLAYLSTSSSGFGEYEIHDLRTGEVSPAPWRSCDVVPRKPRTPPSEGTLEWSRGG